MTFTLIPLILKRWKSSFSKEEEAIVNILKAKKLLLKIHSRLCNPSIPPPHKKFQTNNGDCERKENDLSIWKTKGIISKCPNFFYGIKMV